MVNFCSASHINFSNKRGAKERPEVVQTDEYNKVKGKKIRYKSDIIKMLANMRIQQKILLDEEKEEIRLSKLKHKKVKGPFDSDTEGED